MSSRMNIELEMLKIFNEDSFMEIRSTKMRFEKTGEFSIDRNTSSLVRV